MNPVNDGKLCGWPSPSLPKIGARNWSNRSRKSPRNIRVGIRNARREAIDELKTQKNDKEITEDDLFRLQDEAQKETDKYIGRSTR